MFWVSAALCCVLLVVALSFSGSCHGTLPPSSASSYSSSSSSSSSYLLLLLHSSSVFSSSFVSSGSSSFFLHPLFNHLYNFTYMCATFNAYGYTRHIYIYINRKYATITTTTTTTLTTTMLTATARNMAVVATTTTTTAAFPILFVCTWQIGAASARGIHSASLLSAYDVPCDQTDLRSPLLPWPALQGVAVSVVVVCLSTVNDVSNVHIIAIPRLVW